MSTTTAPKTGWVLSWADEFTNGLGPDWTAVTTDGGLFDDTFGLECYRSEQVSVAGGELRLTAKQAPSTCRGAQKQWVSGLVTTRGRFAQAYGRFEARMRMPTSQGIWPAFWLMPAEAAYGGWPNSGELDVMEYVARPLQSVYASVHWGENGAHKAVSGEGRLNSAPTDWHVYAMEWEPGEVRMYVDGVQYFRHQIPGTGAPFDRAFYLILNASVGGEWPGTPNPADYPATVGVDWVRVYRRG